jgi:hypothetical protein
MLNSIEEKIHHILLDIDPSLQKDYDEQSIIVAEASANYRFAVNKFKIKTSSKLNAKNDEVLMIDSILQAMNSFISTETPKYTYSSYDYNSAEELDYETVLQNLRFSSDMQIINDSDLDSFLENREDNGSIFEIKDIYDDERPNSELYQWLDHKKHRSDSLAR